MSTPTAPLSQVALDAMRRIEQALAGVRVGESTVINGVECTVIDLQTADLLDRYQAASKRCRRLSADPAPDFDRIADLQDEMATCRCQLAAAGQLHLIEATP